MAAGEIEYSLWVRIDELSTLAERWVAFARDSSASFGYVSELTGQEHEIVCPHCKKAFAGELLAEGSRHEGFKCPHCHLFVPAERANDGGGGSS